MRVVGLAECGTHAIVSAALDTWSTGEQTLLPLATSYPVLGGVEGNAV